MTSGSAGTFWITAAVAGMLCVAARAQDLPRPTFRGGIDVVHVDVSVLDGDRRPVRGLTAADFTVLEDGEPRPIVAFAPVELPPRPPEEIARWVRDVPSDRATNVMPPEGRLVVVIVGRTGDLTEIAAARRIAKAVIDGLGPGDLGALVYTSGFFKVGTTQNFTSDKARLRQAVDRPMALLEDAAVDAFSAAWAEPLGGLTVPSLPPTDCQCGVCVFEKITDVADAVAGVPGRRKQIIYAGSSFPPPQLRGGACGQAVRAREAMERALSQANVAISVVDPAGPTGTAGNLPYLTDLTGGRLVLYDNEAEREVPDILEESAFYYVLAFTAAERTRAKDGLNRIKVQVARADVTVQARSAYEVGRTSEALEREMRKAPIVRELESALPRSDVPMSLTATPFPIPGEDTANVLIALRAQSPLYAAADLSDARRQAFAVREDRIDVVVAALDPQGKIVASVKHAGAIPWAPDEAGPAPYELLSRLEVKPGRYEIRAVMDVDSGERSGVYGFVDVPDYGGAALALSGILLEVSPASLTAAKGALADLVPIVPTARREFESTDRVTAFARIVHARTPNRPTIVVSRIRDTQDRVAFERRREMTGDDYSLDVPVNALVAGEYLLEIVAASGPEEAAERVRFKVR